MYQIYGNLNRPDIYPQVEFQLTIFGNFNFKNPDI